MNKLSKLTKYQQTNRIPTISKAFNSLNSSKTSTASRGFTIIELLIVIVIIGILVAITAVSYNGVTKSAKEASLKAGLKQAHTELSLAKAKDGSYPPNASSLTQPSTGTLSLTSNNTDNTYCLTITPPQPNNQNIPSFNITSDTNTIQEGGCPFTNGSDIQTATKANCPTTMTMAVDARDKSTYWIKKLEDNQCWMLTNLAYAGGGTNTYGDVINQGTGAPDTPKGTLSNGTADTANTYTEAKYYISPNANPTTDPTPPSTATDGGVNTSTRQFGYLYNWCAAMGGQDTAACANATTPAPIPTTNICPAGWRLPTGGSGGEFTALNTAINGGSTSSDAGLLTSGLFQRSGYWNGSFYNQGSSGNYWSSTQNSATYAYNLAFNSTNVDPANYDNKSNARAVRCVAE